MPILIILFFVAVFIIVNRTSSNHFGPIIHFRPITKSQKGLYGENKTINYINCVANYDNILHDVNVSDTNGNNAQVDIVVLDNTGIYVVEVKNFADNAKLYLTDKKYVKVYYKVKYEPSQRKEIYNPVWQNRAHIAKLASYLNVPINYFVNIVSIAGGEYVDYVSDKSNATITYAINIGNVIQSEICRRSHILEDADIIRIRRVLKPEKQAEIEYRAEMQAEKQENAEIRKQKISAFIKKISDAVKDTVEKVIDAVKKKVVIIKNKFNKSKGE